MAKEEVFAPPAKKAKKYRRKNAISRDKKTNTTVFKDKKGTEIVRDFHGRFKKGEVGNPYGQPKIPFVKQLQRAMDGKYTTRYAKTVAEHIIEQVYEDPMILSQFMRKIPQEVFNELFGIETPDALKIEIINYKKDSDKEIKVQVGEDTVEVKPIEKEPDTKWAEVEDEGDL